MLPRIKKIPWGRKHWRDWPEVYFQHSTCKEGSLPKRKIRLPTFVFNFRESIMIHHTENPKTLQNIHGNGRLLPEMILPGRVLPFFNVPFNPWSFNQWVLIFIHEVWHGQMSMRNDSFYWKGWNSRHISHIIIITEFWDAVSCFHWMPLLFHIAWNVFPTRTKFAQAKDNPQPVPVCR